MLSGDDGSAEEGGMIVEGVKFVGGVGLDGRRRLLCDGLVWRE